MNRRTLMTDAFQTWVDERVADKRMRPATRDTYLRHCRTFVEAAGNKPIGQIGFDDARTWLNSTADLSASSVSSRMGALKSFFAYLVRQGTIDANPMGRLERPTVTPTHPRPTPKNALEKVMANCVEVGDTRTHLMLRLGSEAGLRRFEIAKVNRADFDFEQMEFDVEGKGGATLNLPMSADLAAEVQAWIDASKVPPMGYLFPGRKQGEPMSAFRCGQAITEASGRVGEHITPHTLRHRAATDMLHTGGGLKAAQRLLRHSSSSTTDIYAKFDVADLRKYVDGLAEQ